MRSYVKKLTQIAGHLNEGKLTPTDRDYLLPLGLIKKGEIIKTRFKRTHTSQRPWQHRLQ